MDSVLLVMAPILIIFLIVLAIDVAVTRSRDRKAADAQARGMSADGASDNTGELIREKRRQGSSVVRICVILGFVLTGSMLYLPPLAWLVSYFGVDSNPPALSMHLALLFALLFIAPFGLLAFLCALVAMRFEKRKDKERERSE